MQKIRFCLGIGLFIASASLAFSQGRDPDPHDVDAGAQRFLTICTACHGADGDQVPGVDLGHDRFRRATTDADLIRIIRNGIPGTAMPANNVSDAVASAIVTYLHSMAASATKDTSTKGNAANGKVLFEGKGGCLSCHMVNGKGSHVGPDLSEIGRFRRSASLETKMIDPNADVAPSNRFVKVVTKDNQSVNGRLLNRDTFTLQLIDAQEHLRSFDMTDVREFTFAEHSSMPSYRGKLSDTEVADLTRYLTTLKGSR